MPTRAAFELDRSIRFAIGRAATLRDASQTPIDVVVEDLSHSGCLFDADMDLPFGSTISIGIPGIGTRLAIISRIDRPHYGCAFQIPLSTHDIATANVADTLVHASFVSTPASVAAIPPLPQQKKYSVRTRVAIILGSSVTLWLSILLFAKLLVF